MTATEYAFVGGLSISCALLVAPIATRMLATNGLRTVLHAGVFFETISLIGASFAKKPWHLFLSQGVCFGWGMGFLFVGSVGIVPQWFLKRRSLANGIAAGGSGLGGLIWSLAVQAMIANPSLGLAWCFRITGIVTCAVNLVAVNLIRDRNRAVGSRTSAFHMPLFRRPEFSLLLAFGILSMLGYVALLFSLPSYAVSVGLTHHQGSVIGAVVCLGQALGRPLIGVISDRAGRLNIAVLFTFITGLVCLVIWTFARSMGLITFFALLSGITSGTYWAVVAPVYAEVMGLQDMPAGLSITWLVLVAPTTVSEAIALKLRTDSGTNQYLHAQLFTGFMFLGAAVCIWVVRGWKVGEVEELERLNAGSHALHRQNTNAEIKSVREAQWKAGNLLRRMAKLKRV